MNLNCLQIIMKMPHCEFGTGSIYIYIYIYFFSLRILFLPFLSFISKLAQLTHKPMSSGNIVTTYYVYLVGAV